MRIDAGVLRGTGYANRSGFTGTVHAFGGSLVPDSAKTSSVGGAGTVYWKGPGQAHGRPTGTWSSTTRTARSRPRARSSALALGATALESSGGFATSDTMHEGQWVVVNGADQTPFLILANTQTVLTTDPATGDMRAAGNPGDAYQGAIILRNPLRTALGLSPLLQPSRRRETNSRGLPDLEEAGIQWGVGGDRLAPLRAKGRGTCQRRQSSCFSLGSANPNEQ